MAENRRRHQGIRVGGSLVAPGAVEDQVQRVAVTAQPRGDTGDIRGRSDRLGQGTAEVVEQMSKLIVGSAHLVVGEKAFAHYFVGREDCQTTVGGTSEAPREPPILAACGSVRAMPSPPLAQRIEAWCRARGHDLTGLEILAGDVSARRYARVRLGGRRTAIVVFYPPELRAVSGRFQATTALYERAGIRVPKVIDSEDGGEIWMLLEDLGHESLYDHGRTIADGNRRWAVLESWFRQAADLRRAIGALEASAIEGLNPPLDETLLRAELGMTWEELLAPRGVVRDAGFASALEASLDALCRALGAAPAVVCHRDFMARNLMIAGDRLAVIDHQDTRIGPSAYDLASLLNDSLFVPPKLESDLLAESSDIDRDDYARAVAQRTLKALGTFARATRAGSDAYRPLIAPTLSRAVRALGKAPETAEISGPFAAACATMKPNGADPGRLR